MLLSIFFSKEYGGLKTKDSYIYDQEEHFCNTLNFMSFET